MIRRLKPSRLSPPAQLLSPLPARIAFLTGLDAIRRLLMFIASLVAMW